MPGCLGHDRPQMELVFGLWLDPVERGSDYNVGNGQAIWILSTRSGVSV